MTQVNEEEFERHRSLARSCWFLTGATAGGKSAVSLRLAKALGAEIISMDSMTIYREMDIGTAKPSISDRNEITHHCIDIRSPAESFSVSEYYQIAFEIANDIKQRGKEVLFVGGTALYLKSVLRGHFEGPPPDWDFRNKIQEEIDANGHEELRKRLMQVDPLSAHKLHPNDIRRTIRAPEVYKITGSPISHLQTQFEEESSAEENHVFSLRWPRETLHQRIDQRVERMFENGFVDEVTALKMKYSNLSKTASQAVGYKEVLEFLDGKLDQEKLIELVKVRTHQFARHQETWFRGLAEVNWIERSEEITLDSVVDQILATKSA